MNKPERQFWIMLNQKGRLPGVTERVENICGGGMPDVSGAFLGQDYWIELKVCTNKNKIRGPELLMQETQPVWHLRRAREGSLIFVMVRYTEDIIIYKALKEFRKYQMINSVSKTKGKFDWAFFTEILQRDIRGIF